MSRYKIIFIDIDDILNQTSNEVSAYTKSVIKRIRALGVDIVAITGRETNYACQHSREAGLSEYVISSNGSEIYNYITKENIFARHIPKETVKKVYEYCNNLNMTVIFNSFTRKFINNKKYVSSDTSAIYFDNLDKLLDDYEINQITVLSRNYERMLVLPNVFLDKFPNLRTVSSSLALNKNKSVSNEVYYHNLVLENTSKKTGIAELLDYLKLKPEDAIAIGNGYDDLTMFDLVDKSITVENNVTFDEIVASLKKYILEENENEI